MLFNMLHSNGEEYIDGCQFGAFYLTLKTHIAIIIASQGGDCSKINTGFAHH